LPITGIFIFFYNLYRGDNSKIKTLFFERGSKLYDRLQNTLLRFEFLEIVEREQQQSVTTNVGALNADLTNIDQLYSTVMKPQQIQQHSFLQNKCPLNNHHYLNVVPSNLDSALISRLSQEITDLSNSLPSESTNAIFVRYDTERIDIMKALIMGAKDTPYSSGAFVFDIAFPSDYPRNPPKVWTIFFTVILTTKVSI
jgi:hypothetical protein